MNNNQNGIKCGHCGQRHPTVADVRACGFDQQVAALTSVADKASEPQKQFISDLLDQRVEPDWTTLRWDSAPDVENISKREASLIIDVLKKQPRKPGVGGHNVPKDIPDGRYAFLHERLKKIVFYRVSTGGDERRWVSKVLGAPGDFRYERITPAEATNAIKAIEASGPGFASQLFGKAVGACGVCGSPLTDPESIALGIGPVCAKKYDW